MTDTIENTETPKTEKPTKKSWFSRILPKRRKRKDGAPWWRPSAAALIALAVLTGGLALRYVDPWFVETVRLRTFDAYNRMHPRQPPPKGQNPVVIIDIDEKSLEEMGQWPWPRTVIADLIAAARDYQMPVIGFDMVFGELDRTSPARIADSIRRASDDTVAELKTLPPNEVIMAETMRTMQTVLGQAGSNGQQVKKPTAISAFTAVKGAKKTVGVPAEVDLSTYAPSNPTLIFNLETLEQSASGLGVFSVDEEVDGVVRRVPLVVEIEGVVKPTLSVEMLRVAFNASSIFGFIDQGGIREIRLQSKQGNFPIPTDGNGRLWVYYSEPDAFNTPDNTGRWYISASDIVNRRIPPERLAGKVGLVGTSAIGLYDIRATPIEPRLPGVEVHANIIENIVMKEHVAYPVTSSLWEFVVAALAGLALIILIPRVGPVFSLLGGSVAAGVLIYTSWHLFTEEHILLDVTYPTTLTFAVYAVMTFANYMRDAAEKRQVRTAFGQYLSPALVEQLAENPDMLVLGGETKKMTLLFCDVRGFTTISEQYKTNPQGLTRLINRLLTPLTGEILKREGTIDKYMGDCIMAFWNAPVDVQGQELRSIESALAMFKSLQALNEVREREAEAEGIKFLPLNIGIGINTGDVVVGNMGSEQRFDYSVLGDAVNLAARLEGQSKSYGVGVVLGPDTAEEAKDTYPIFELDQIAVKGKTEAVNIFTVAGGIESRNADYEALLADHNSMLEAYRSQRFDEADALCTSCQGRLDGVLDGFYDIYRERIAEYRINPPAPDWDGVFIATTK